MRPAIDPVSLPLLEHTELNLQLEVAMQDDVWIKGPPPAESSSGSTDDSD